MIVKMSDASVHLGAKLSDLLRLYEVPIQLLSHISCCTFRAEISEFNHSYEFSDSHSLSTCPVPWAGMHVTCLESAEDIDGFVNKRYLELRCY